MQSNDDGMNNYTIVENGKNFEIVLPIINLIIGTVGLICNATVMCIFSSKSARLSMTHVFLISLAISDFFYLLFGLTMTYINYYKHPFFLEEFCSTFHYILVVVKHESIFTLVLICIDRYVAILLPSSVIRTKHNALKAVTCISIVIILISIFNLIICVSGGEYPYSDLCSHVLIFDEGFCNYWLFFTSFVLPVFTMIFLYSRMLKEVYKVRAGERISARRKTMRRKVARTVIINLIVFLVCWTPVQVNYI